jgi:hypothetical protein
VDQSIAARRAEIAARYRQRRRPVSVSVLRLRELMRLARARYPQGITDTPDGRTMVRIIAHHLGALQGDQRRRITEWLAEHAPWLPLRDGRALLAEVASRPRRWRADRLGARLKLLEADRAALRITTIGAVDLDKEARAARRKEAKRQAKLNRRRLKGAKPRARYESESLSRTKPWEAEGISRRTWERRRRTMTQV